ncbi:hypothetical protein CL673_00990 [Candidatus Bathyarchaeota archaeon]|nr:hypothetical protein [Candidatus Bathyarchaeota archaeon]
MPFLDIADLLEGLVYPPKSLLPRDFLKSWVESAPPSSFSPSAQPEGSLPYSLSFQRGIGP